MPLRPRRLQNHEMGKPKNKKAPSLRRGFMRAAAGLKTCRCQRYLLGSGSASSCRGSSVSSSLCGVSSRSRGSGVGSGRSCLGGCRCGSWSGGWCRCFHRSGSRCWSGFFLLATSGECSSCDQGGQNERVLHFDIPSWTDRVLREATASGFESPGSVGTCTWLAPLRRSHKLYWYLVNSD